MDIRQLKFFLAVVDHNGFSRAAEHLMVAQPSLSQAIATFERELGCRCFTASVAASSSARPASALVGPARVVLRDLDEAKADHELAQRAARRPDRPRHHALSRYGAADHHPHHILAGASRRDRQRRSRVHPRGGAGAGPLRFRRDRRPGFRRAHCGGRPRRRAAGTPSPGADLGAQTTTGRPAHPSRARISPAAGSSCRNADR